MKTIKRTVPGSLLFLCVSGLTGCQTLFTAPGEQAAPVVAAPQNQVTVEVRPSNRKPTENQLVLTTNMRLQDAVAATKTKFRNKDVYIVRVSPLTGQKHKLSAVYDRASRRVTMDTDYAIQSGDRVVIAQDTTTSLERVMKDFLGRS